jgi:putative transposase
MCEVLAVSRSGYYACLNRKRSIRDKANEILIEQIRQAYEKSRKTYGAPRIHAQLIRESIVCGRGRVARLMRTHGLQGKVYARYMRFKRMKPRKQIAENLLKRQFDVPLPNRVWAGDITHFWTSSGWLYLAVVLDLYSRKVIGWSMRGSMTEKLVVDALDMAVLARGTRHKDLIHHSDRGGQYISQALRERLKDHNIHASMSVKGDCYDNAVVESFFKTLKYELSKDRTFKTRDEAKQAVFEYIEVFYNRNRLHSTLGYLTPVEYERRDIPKQTCPLN